MLSGILNAATSLQELYKWAKLSCDINAKCTCVFLIFSLYFINKTCLCFSNSESIGGNVRQPTGQRSYRIASRGRPCRLLWTRHSRFLLCRPGERGRCREGAFTPSSRHFKTTVTSCGSTVAHTTRWPTAKEHFWWHLNFHPEIHPASSHPLCTIWWLGFDCIFDCGTV